MLFEVRFFGQGRLLSQDEVLDILTEGPYELQLFFVHSQYRNYRHRLDFPGNEKQVAWLEAKREVDLFDALFLPDKERQRLTPQTKYLHEPGGFN